MTDRAVTRAATRIGIGAFAVLVLISAAQIYALRRALDESISILSALGYGVGTFIVWAMAVPLVVYLGGRYDGRPGRRLTSLAVHLVAMVAIQVPATLVVVLTGLTLFGGDEAFPWGELPRQVLLGSRFQFGFLIYVAILGLQRGLSAWHALRARELEATRLEAQAVRARLEALASRLQPHFLFNALHTVGALIDEDPVRAREVLTRLGDLLREVLAEPAAAEIPLADELRLLARYTEIEQVRFADRLRVETDLAPAAAAVRVPRFLLQPVVENALRHGIAPLARGGRVRVSAAIEGGRLRLEVANDGAPLARDPREGVGLRTTRERLRTRYGDRGTVRLVSDGAMVRTIIEIPLDGGDG
ncbi:MAG: histidine kinase [Gemmatimonadetes bacterium]|nr:histidine kinase [Gemmatimonadota bacterium]HPF61572.1 histidine kinase [Gemmatimonadales bacterium]